MAATIIALLLFGGIAYEAHHKRQVVACLSLGDYEPENAKGEKPRADAAWKALG